MKRDSLEGSPLVVGIGGGGCHVEASSIPFRMIASSLENSGEADFASVNGCVEEDDSEVVLPPSRQLQLIEEIVDSQPEGRPIALIGQCIGGIAVIDFLRQHPALTNVQGVVFSPATRPRQVVNQPISQARRHRNDTIMRLNRLKGDIHVHDIEVDHMIDAILPPEYLGEIEAISSYEMIDTIADLANDGRLTVWATQDDWNETSPLDIDSLARSGAGLSQRLHVVPRAGHSLHLPGNYQSRPDSRLRFQRNAVARVLQAALRDMR